MPPRGRKKKAPGPAAAVVFSGDHLGNMYGSGLGALPDHNNIAASDFLDGIWHAYAERAISPDTGSLSTHCGPRPVVLTMEGGEGTLEGFNDMRDWGPSEWWDGGCKVHFERRGSQWAKPSYRDRQHQDGSSYLQMNDSANRAITEAVNDDVPFEFHIMAHCLTEDKDLKAWTQSRSDISHDTPPNTVISFLEGDLVLEMRIDGTPNHWRDPGFNCMLYMRKAQEKDVEMLSPPLRAPTEVVDLSKAAAATAPEEAAAVPPPAPEGTARRQSTRKKRGRRDDAVNAAAAAAVTAVTVKTEPIDDDAFDQSRFNQLWAHYFDVVVYTGADAETAGGARLRKVVKPPRIDRDASGYKHLKPALENLRAEGRIVECLGMLERVWKYEENPALFGGVVAGPAGGGGVMEEMDLTDEKEVVDADSLIIDSASAPRAVVKVEESASSSAAQPTAAAAPPPARPLAYLEDAHDGEPAGLPEQSQVTHPWSTVDGLWTPYATRVRQFEYSGLATAPQLGNIMLSMADGVGTLTGFTWPRKVGVGPEKWWAGGGKVRLMQADPEWSMPTHLQMLDSDGQAIEVSYHDYDGFQPQIKMYIVTEDKALTAWTESSYEISRSNAPPDTTIEFERGDMVLQMLMGEDGAHGDTATYRMYLARSDFDNATMVP